MKSKLLIQAARMTRVLNNTQTGLPNTVRSQMRVSNDRPVAASQRLGAGARFAASSPPTHASTVGRHGVQFYPSCYVLGNDVLQHVEATAGAAAALSECQWRARWNGNDPRLACMAEEVVFADALAELTDASTELASRCP